VADRDAISCIAYAAKSTQDKRGSISGQLAECRALIADRAGCSLAAEYVDEAFSAYSGNRGPGLAEAMQHAEDLAAEHGRAELWAQHSDRLARGDGQAARHTVEVALWALKHDALNAVLAHQTSDTVTPDALAGAEQRLPHPTGPIGQIVRLVDLTDPEPWVSRFRLNRWTRTR
jgi:resolvase-like protein